MKNALVLQNDKVRRTLWFVWFRSNWPVKRSCTYTYIHMWLVYLHIWGKLFRFVLVRWPQLLKWWIMSYEPSWKYIHWTFLLWNSSVNEIECEYMLKVIIYVECIYVDWWLYMLSAYMLIGDYICWMHICWLLVSIYVECIYVDCWWLYMLNAYILLLVMIYVMYIYVVDILIHAIGDEYVGVSMNLNMLVWTCEICMRHVLLWSSPSSHTLLLLSFISNCCWMLRYSLCGLLCGLLWRVYKRQGRRPRRWKRFGITHSWVGLVTLYVF